MPTCSNCGEKHLATADGGTHWMKNRKGIKRCTYRMKRDRNGLIW